MEHRAYLSYNEKEFTDWANTVGHSTAAVVKYFLGGKEAEQGYKYCASMTKLCDRYGPVRLRMPASGCCPSPIPLPSEP